MEELFVDKFKPTTLDGVVMNAKQKAFFQAYIDKKTLPNMTLSGTAGIGKTLTAHIVAKAVGGNIKYINGSIERNVDVINKIISEFCSRMSINDEGEEQLKVVIISEADNLSSNDGTSANGSSAQSSLKDLIEMYQDKARFILTTNNVNNLVEAVTSRCGVINLSFSLKEAIGRCGEIVKETGVEVNKELFEPFVEDVIKAKFPDLRSMIGEIERWTSTGTFCPYQVATSHGEIIDFINANFRDVPTVRKFLMENAEKFNNDYQKLAGQLFSVHTDDLEVMSIIADSLRHQPHVADHEIEFTNMLIKLGKL